MFKKLIKYIVSSRQRTADEWILRNMTDYELRDIGINRSDINRRLNG
jgi:uncharacterized protein YjiS (DUF1127 family)